MRWQFSRVVIPTYIEQFMDDQATIVPLAQAIW
jgi:hypothetical protein